MLVLVKELNEQFKRKIKIVLPIDLVLVSMNQHLAFRPAMFAVAVGNLQRLTLLSKVSHS